MAEVIRTLANEERGSYVPFDEMLKSDCDEVYEAVGEHLMLAYELDGEIETPADLLVNLNQGKKVAFSLGGCINIDAISPDLS